MEVIINPLERMLAETSGKFLNMTNSLGAHVRKPIDAMLKNIHTKLILQTSPLTKARLISENSTAARLPFNGPSFTIAKKSTAATIETTNPM